MVDQVKFWEASYEIIFDYSPDAIVFFDKNEAIQRINPRFTEIFGYSLDQVKGKNINSLIDPDRKLNNYRSTDILKGKRIHETTTRFSKSGEELSVVLIGVPLVIDGEVHGGYAIYSDKTKVMQTETKVGTFAHILDYSPSSVVITNSNGNIEYVNRKFTEVTGFEFDEVYGKNPRILKSGSTPKEVYEDLWNTITQGETWKGEIVNKKKNGERYWESLSISCVKNIHDETIHYVAIKEDITERKQLEKTNYYLAFHDPLTGLPNRVSFIKKLNGYIDEGSCQQIAVLFIDLDRFKNVNDSLGHDFGDFLLQSVAERLQEEISDRAELFRIGGDEFTLIVKEATHVTEIADTINNIFSAPFRIIEQDFFVTVSMGISVYPQDGRDSNVLLKNADTAMYVAKEKGRNQYQFYRPVMNDRAEEFLLLENELRQALQREEFYIHYQPQVDLNTKQIKGFEALVRWNHPRLKVVSPADFIPIAEETGLIVSIGKWILKSACHANKKLIDEQQFCVPMAVNISGKQFIQSDFVETVEAALQESGLDPKFLELEITETIAMNDIDWVIEVLNRLRKLGVAVSIDDFGTGYSSLNNFRRFPINKLKIDRSFVNRITYDLKDLAIVKSIITMAHSLGLKVVAEGVETLEQHNILSEYACDMYQGYLFSRPIPEEKLELLKEATQESAASTELRNS